IRNEREEDISAILEWLQETSAPCFHTRPRVNSIQNCQDSVLRFQKDIQKSACQYQEENSDTGPVYFPFWFPLFPVFQYDPDKQSQKHISKRHLPCGIKHKHIPAAAYRSYDRCYQLDIPLIGH